MSCPAEVRRELFNAIMNKKSINQHPRSYVLNDEQYEDKVKEVREAITLNEQGKTMTAKQYRRLRKFSVQVISGEQRLLEKHLNVHGSVRNYCKIGEMFDILEEQHTKKGHRCRVIDAELKKKYANITRYVIETYLSFCNSCTNKVKRRSVQKYLTKPKHGLWRGHVEVIEVDSTNTEGYQFVLTYVDCTNDFTILRALKTNDVEEIADQLVDIFCLFPPPHVLQSVNGTIHAKKIVKQVSELLPTVKIVYGKTEDIKTKNIGRLISEWMSKNDTKDWVNNLLYIQEMANVSPNTPVSAYVLMFGVKQIMGLSSSNLTVSYSNIKSEEELKERLIAHDVNLNESEKYPVSETGNSSKEVDSETNKDNDDENSDSENSDDSIDEHSDSEISNDYIDDHMESLDDDITDIDETIKCVACGVGTEVSEILRCENCKKLFHVTCVRLVKETDEGKSLICHMCTGEAQTPNNDPGNLPSTSAQTYPIGTNVIVTDLNSECVPVKTLAFITDYVSDINLYQLATKQGDLRRLFKPEEIEIVNYENTAEYTSSIAQKEKEREGIKRSLHRKNFDSPKCKCIRDCNSMKCKCRSLNFKCNERCHNGTDCLNQSY